MLKGFFAYCSFPEEVGSTIDQAIHDLRRYHSPFEITLWPELDSGRFIAATVLGEIDSSDFVIADITSLNFNVIYEVGYAIGRRKRVHIVRNHPYASSSIEVTKELGIFDTLGFKSYENSRELVAYLKRIGNDEANTIISTFPP